MEANKTDVANFLHKIREKNLGCFLISQTQSSVVDENNSVTEETATQHHVMD